MINLELIKASGVFLGLEAELNRQRSIQEQHVKDRKWQGALQANEDIGELLQEIIRLGKPTCELTTSRETNSKQ